jgi:membrane dipeptidase
MDAITITLCDPKPEGDEALALAVDSLLEHDKPHRRAPDLFVKATSAADLDRARRAGKLAVFYLYQNTVQFGRARPRGLLPSVGLRSCQLTYNTRTTSASAAGSRAASRPSGASSSRA